MIKDTYILGVFPVTACQSKTTVLLMCLRKFWELTLPTSPKKSTPIVGSGIHPMAPDMIGIHPRQKHRIFGVWVVMFVIYQILSFTGGVTTKCKRGMTFHFFDLNFFPENWWQDRPIYPGGCNATCIAARIDVYLSCGTKVRSGKCANQRRLVGAREDPLIWYTPLNYFETTAVSPEKCWLGDYLIFWGCFQEISWFQGG